jgi:hypothetical protein
MRPVPRWFVVACWVLAINFSLWTGLQANDPDPMRWIVIYGSAAVVTAALPTYRVAAAFGAVVGAIAVVWGVYLAHHVWGVVAISDLWSKMSARGGAVEVGREAGGQLIVGVWMIGASAFRYRRRD